MGKMITIPLHGSVTAGARVTLVSRRLSFPYIIRKVRVSCALGHERTVEHYFYVDYDDSAPTTAPTMQENILAPHSPYPYLVGDDNEVVAEVSENVYVKGTYLKLHGSNSDTSTHTLDGSFTIEDMSGVSTEGEA